MSFFEIKFWSIIQFLRITHLEIRRSLTLDKGAIEPLDVVAVRIEDKDLIAGDRNRKQKGRADGDRQGDCAQPKTDPVYGGLIFVHRQIIFAIAASEARDQRVAGDVQQQKK